jgi:VIT1/CCC1 family predicted Fe2+/Mn2+ transporter
MYEHQGLAHDDAEKVAAILMSKPDVALDAHARLELGVDPEEPPSARKAALASFVSFSFGAFIPLFPWLFWSGTGAIVGSIRNVAVAALTKNLADELGPKGVNVTVVHPGLTRTEKTGPLVAARAGQV